MEEQIPSWLADSQPANQEISFYGTQEFTWAHN
jgi:hypothetical protein